MEGPELAREGAHAPPGREAADWTLGHLCPGGGEGAAEVGPGAPQGGAREQAGLRAGWVQRTRSVQPSGTRADLSPQSKLERRDKTPVA